MAIVVKHFQKYTIAFRPMLPEPPWASRQLGDTDDPRLDEDDSGGG